MNAEPGSARIKFCGMRRGEDVQQALTLGVDYLGFVFVPGTPRAVEVDEVRRVQESLDCTAVCRVGVFRGATIDTVNDIVHRAQLDLVQWHEAGPVPAWTDFAVPVIRMLPVASAASQARDPDPVHAEDNVYAVLLDAADAAGRSGGLGVQADAQALRRARAAVAADVRCGLAGGLTPHNVSAIVEQLQPDVVDVSSGIESQPGVKDPESMRAFVAAVRRENAS